MIVVTGATGHFGRLVAEALLHKLGPQGVGVSVRDPEKAVDLAERGVRVVRGDFAEPDTLPAAFDGAEQVLLVSVNALGDVALRQHAAAIHAAQEAGVKRILYTSHQAARAGSGVAFARDHAATEDLLRASGVAFVSLRNGFYAESALYQLGDMAATGELALPADGPVSWTARADLAEAAVAALTDPALFDGISPPLTAGTTLLFADVAREAATILGRPIRRTVLTDDAYLEAKLAHGYPLHVAGMLAAMFAATRDGDFNVVDPTLERVLGRKPTPFADILRPALAPAS